jgi:hypothetical protein
VEPEKRLADPFVDRRTRTSSGFMDRLLAGNVKISKGLGPIEDQVEKNARMPVDSLDQCQTEVEGLPPNPAKLSLRTGLKEDGNSRVPKKSTHPTIKDLEKTLVNSENEPPSDDSPGEMTRGTSNDSLEDDQSKSSQQTQISNDGWNLALRPHYAKLSAAVHRIADVCISFLVG